MVATACLLPQRDLVAEAAEILGRDADAAHFAALAEQTRAAFVEHYVHDDGTIHSDAPTVYALAIVFGLLDESGTSAPASGWRSWWPRAATTSRPASPAPRS